MNDADNQNTAALLPQSGVAIFSADAETIRAANQIAEDWRFARVSVHVNEGDVNTAIDVYASSRSPNLVIVQTDDIDESFIEKLGTLAENCDEGTSAIVIGPVNDVYLYRKLIDMGVSDYLVKPVDTAMFVDVISKTLIEQIGVIGSRLIAFMGAKGGVGTSSFVEAVGWGLSDGLAQTVMLVDAGGGWSTHTVGLGFEPAGTLSHVAHAVENNDSDNLERMIFKASERFSVLSTGGDAMMDEPMDREQCEAVLEALMVKYPVVLVDLSNATPQLKKMVCALAHKIVVVSSAVLPSLRLARTLLDEVKSLRGGNQEGVHMVINMRGFSPNYELSKGDIEKALGFNPSMTLPFDPKVFVGIECEDRNISNDKDGKILLSKHIQPFLTQELGFDGGDGLDSAPVEGASSGGIFSGFLSKVGAKEKG